MSDWRKEWRNSAIYDHIGDCIDTWARLSGPDEDSMEMESRYWMPVVMAIEAAMETVEQEARAAAYEDAAKIAEQADGCVRDDPDDCTVGYEIARVFRAKAKEITG